MHGIELPGISRNSSPRRWRCRFPRSFPWGEPWFKWITNLGRVRFGWLRCLLLQESSNLKYGALFLLKLNVHLWALKFFYWADTWHVILMVVHVEWLQQALGHFWQAFGQNYDPVSLISWRSLKERQECEVSSFVLVLWGPNQQVSDEPSWIGLSWIFFCLVSFLVS